MPSKRAPVTVRFRDKKNKLKLDYIAEIEGRSTSREAERALIQHIKTWEGKHGEIKIKLDTDLS